MKTTSAIVSLQTGVLALMSMVATPWRADAGFTDCQPNGLDDDCDFSCAAQAGACNVPGCGLSIDCNGNLIPDECDVPFVWDGGGDGVNWHSANNWNPNVVPNSIFAFVVIDGLASNVVLNNSAIVASVELTNGASLLISGGNLTVGSCGMLIEGALRTKNNRTTSVLGDVTIGPDGSYEAHATATAVDTSTLEAENITVLEGPGGQEPGKLVIDRQMTVNAQGDALFDGTNAEPCNLLAFGGCRPPLLQIEGSAVLDTNGSLSFSFSVNVKIGTLLPLNDDLARSGPVHHHIELGGDFINTTNVAACFDADGGAIMLDGAAPQDYEAASFAPQNVPTEFYFTNNFAFGEVEVAPGRTVNVRNDFANQPFGGAETLVVNGLTIGNAANLNAMSASIAFSQISDLGGNLSGNINSIAQLQLPAASAWGVAAISAAVAAAATLGIRRRIGGSRLVAGR
ncbi:MAG: hypothetical protein HOP29_02010 [Phycisphaerales bacterium]|nr:hypothetical protein [Phycisphaerales bacterium]